jgi:hypothetical protein
MIMPDNNPDTERFGGPGSSHQDREHPGKNHQPTGHKHAGETSQGPAPGAPTNTDKSRVSGGGGERDTHHTHTAKRS